MFLGALRTRKFSEHTVGARLKTVRRFYEYLARIEKVEKNPADMVAQIKAQAPERNIPTIDELAALWDASRGGERVIIGLLGFCAMRRDEIRMARAEDLHERQGITALTLRSRVGATDLGYVAVPDELALEIRRHLGGRKSGPILRNLRSGAGMVSSTYINHVVARLVREVGLGRMTSLNLSHALRAYALENRFSYASVLQTASSGGRETTNDLLRRLDLPIAEHASIRFGRILAARVSHEEQLLLHAENLLMDRSQHPVASVMLASATLERTLRNATAEHGLQVTKKDPSLSTYATLLRSKALLSLSELRTVERILTFRNDSAHGWFERVSKADAEWVLQEARKLIRSLASLREESARDTQRITVHPENLGGDTQSNSVTDAGAPTL